MVGLDASVSAGIQRFILSEYGKVAAQGKITYTIIFNGPFLELGLNHGFLGPELKKRQTTYLDGGVSKFSTTTLANVGKAVVGVLAKPEDTKNRAVYVQDAVLTLKNLFRLSKKVPGEERWTEIDGRTTEDKEKLSFEELAKGQKDMGVIIGFLLSTILREGYGGHSQQLDNALLGIDEMKGSEIVELIRKVAKGQTA